MRTGQSAFGILDLNGPVVDDQINVFRHYARMALQDATCRAGFKIDDNDCGIGTASRIADINAVADAIHCEIIDESVFRSDWRRQINDTVQAVGFGIPTHQFGGDTATHAVIQHPYDTIGICPDAKHRIQG